MSPFLREDRARWLLPDVTTMLFLGEPQNSEKIVR